MSGTVSVTVLKIVPPEFMSEGYIPSKVIGPILKAFIMIIDVAQTVVSPSICPEFRSKPQHYRL
eukprot:2636133-Amphidinium_carterae.1